MVPYKKTNVYVSYFSLCGTLFCALISKKYIRPKEIRKVQVKISKKDQSTLRVNGVLVVKKLLKYYINKGKAWS